MNSLLSLKILEQDPKIASLLKRSYPTIYEDVIKNIVISLLDSEKNMTEFVIYLEKNYQIEGLIALIIQELKERGLNQIYSLISEMIGASLEPSYPTFPNISKQLIQDLEGIGDILFPTGYLFLIIQTEKYNLLKKINIDRKTISFFRRLAIYKKNPELYKIMLTKNIQFTSQIVFQPSILYVDANAISPPEFLDIDLKFILKQKDEYIIDFNREDRYRLFAHSLITDAINLAEFKELISRNLIESTEESLKKIWKTQFLSSDKLIFPERIKIFIDYILAKTEEFQECLFQFYIFFKNTPYIYKYIEQKEKEYASN